MSATRSIARRLALVALVTGVAALVLLAPRLGVFLSVEDPLEPADVIYVLAGTRVVRPLEAADLYHAGYAPLILLSDGQPEAAELALERRGVEVIGDAERARAVLVQLGVPRDALLFTLGPVNSTRAEALMLRAMAGEQGWRKVITITSKLHTRRARLALRQALAGTGTTVMIRGSRYDESDPSRWWQRRGDVRTALTELQFLLVYARWGSRSEGRPAEP